MGNNLEIDLKKMRMAYSTLIRQADSMKIELDTVRNRLSLLENYGKEGAPDIERSRLLLSQLQCALALRFEKPVKALSLDVKQEKQQIVLIREGYFVACMKVRIACDLAEFSGVSHAIRETAPREYDAVFYPRFSETQFLSASILSFCIKLATFSSLCDAMNTISHSDRLKRVRKCGKGPDVDTRNILGCIKSGSRKKTSPL